MNKGNHQKDLREDAERVLGPGIRLPAIDRIPRGDIIDLRKLGYSLQRIANYYDVSHMTIWRILGPVSAWENRDIWKTRAANAKAARIKAKRK